MEVYVHQAMALQDLSLGSHLDSFALWYSRREPVFDRIVYTAAEIFRCPTTTIALSHDERIYHKSSIGLTDSARLVCDTLIDMTMRGDAPNVVADMFTDPRFVGNDALMTNPAIRFFVGVPLLSAQGRAPGMLAVMDTRPITPKIEQIAALTLLARQTQRLIAARLSEAII
jgi:hypothetical protein